MSVATLNGAINGALKDAAYAKKMTDEGVQILGGTPEDFRSYLSAERKRWGAVIQKVGTRLK